MNRIMPDIIATNFMISITVFIRYDPATLYIFIYINCRAYGTV